MTTENVHGAATGVPPLNAPRGVPPGAPAAASAAAHVMVVKVGGRVQGDPALAPALARLCAARPAGVVVVHGGGDEVTALQRAFGIEPRFVGGRRVTSERDLDFVRMALSGTSNKRLVAALRATGLAAVGISGEDAATIAALPGDPALGRVGTVAGVDARLLHTLLAAGYVPVVSPVACDASVGGTGALNVNGDDAAAAVATALGADEVVFLADVPGVLEADALVPALDPAGARALIARGVAAGGMAAKLEAAVAALAGGVRRARVAGLAALDDPDAGTLLEPARGASAASAGRTA